MQISTSRDSIGMTKLKSVGGQALKSTTVVITPRVQQGNHYKSGENASRLYIRSGGRASSFEHGSELFSARPDFWRNYLIRVRTGIYI